MIHYDEYKFNSNKELDAYVDRWLYGELYFITNTPNYYMWQGPLERFKEYGSSVETIPPYSFLKKFTEGPTRIRMIDVSRNMEQAVAEFMLYLNLRIHESMDVIVVVPKDVNKIQLQNILLNYSSDNFRFRILHNQEEELNVDEGDVERREWERKNKRKESGKAGFVTA